MKFEFEMFLKGWMGDKRFENVVFSSIVSHAYGRAKKVTTSAVSGINASVASYWDGDTERRDRSHCSEHPG